MKVSIALLKTDLTGATRNTAMKRKDENALTLLPRSICIHPFRGQMTTDIIGWPAIAVSLEFFSATNALLRLLYAFRVVLPQDLLIVFSFGISLGMNTI
jgi:hypothetical protein